MEGFYEYIFTPVAAADGSVEFVAGSTRDITERARSADALRDGERQQRQLAELLEIERSRLVAAQRVSRIGSWETDLSTFQMLWSHETHHIFGTEPSTFQPSHEKFLEIIHPDDRNAVNEAFARSLHQRAPCSIGHRLRFPDGTVKFVEERWQVFFDQSEKPTVAIGTCQDITERKQGESTLRLQSAALNAAGNAMVITDRDFNIVWLNHAFTELTGFAEDEAVGRNVTGLLKPEGEDSKLDQEIRETIDSGWTWRGERSRRRKDGRVYPESMTVTPVADEAGTITHFISMKTDLTAQRQMEARLRQAQKMEAVGQLAAGVAHEFNNILQTLMSMTTITRLRSVSPEIVKIATEMETQIRRGAGVTQQLLLVSRHQPLSKTRLDLCEEVRAAGALLRRLLPENIALAIVPAAAPAWAEVDAGQIQQVLLNLAINARDAMPGGGALTFALSSTHDSVTIAVEDNGEGFDDAVRERLFEPFFTTKSVGTGTGLGLAVVYGIVQEHGGRIEVDSSPGHGSCFRVILPTSSPGREADVAASHEETNPSGSGRVLLVEDEQLVREGLTMLLRMIGYEVIAVGRGEDALELPLEPVPDLLLSDVSLPGIGGPALAGQLRARWPSIKVTLMTGYADAATREQASSQKWTILQKPFELEELSIHLGREME